MEFALRTLRGINLHLLIQDGRRSVVQVPPSYRSTSSVKPQGLDTGASASVEREAPARRCGTEDIVMPERHIDPVTVELYLEEIRHNPADRDPALDELVELYRLQERLIERYYEGTL